MRGGGQYHDSHYTWCHCLDSCWSTHSLPTIVCIPSVPCHPREKDKWHSINVTVGVWPQRLLKRSGDCRGAQSTPREPPLSTWEAWWPAHFADEGTNIQRDGVTCLRGTGRNSHPGMLEIESRGNGSLFLLGYPSVVCDPQKFVQKWGGLLISYWTIIPDPAGLDSSGEKSETSRLGTDQPRTQAAKCSMATARKGW